MKKPIALAAALTLTFALGVGAAIAAVSWPSTATTWAGVNSHLNALHATDGTQFSKVKIMTEEATQSGGNSLNGGIKCPAGWIATGGGFRNVDPGSETQSPDGDWYVTNFTPTFPMGPAEITPNGYSGDFVDLTPGDPFPTITLYAICVT